MSNLDSNELYSIIGKNIKYYRKLYNLQKGKMTQENLAELTDVSTALIGNLESEKIMQGLSVFTMWKICKALEIPVEKLFDDSDLSERAIQILRFLQKLLTLILFYVNIFASFVLGGVVLMMVKTGD